MPLPVFGVERISDAETVYLRAVDDPAFAHIQLVATMFEGDVPLRIRIADTGKLWAAMYRPSGVFAGVPGVAGGQ